MRGPLDAIVHPLPFTSRRNNPGTTQVSEMARDLWLALAQNFHEVAHADLPPIHQIEQAQTRAIGKRGE